VAIIYTPYQAINGDHKNEKPIKILPTKIIELEKLHDNRLEVQNNVGANQWSKFLWSQHKNKKKKFQFGDYVMRFFKGKKSHLGKFKKIRFGPFRYNIAYPITLFFFFLLIILNQTQYWSILTS
jgi:hypothetical protein